MVTVGENLIRITLDDAVDQLKGLCRDNQDISMRLPDEIDIELDLIVDPENLITVSASASSGEQTINREIKTSTDTGQTDSTDNRVTAETNNGNSTTQSTDTGNGTTTSQSVDSNTGTTTSQSVDSNSSQNAGQTVTTSNRVQTQSGTEANTSNNAQGGGSNQIEEINYDEFVI